MRRAQPHATVGQRYKEAAFLKAGTGGSPRLLDQRSEQRPASMRLRTRSVATVSKIGEATATERRPLPLEVPGHWLRAHRPTRDVRLFATSVLGRERGRPRGSRPGSARRTRRCDGKGYPDGLAGEQIPLSSRISFVCDAYHAMTSDRPYRAALSPAAAREEIAAGAGSQFCPTSA